MSSAKPIKVPPERRVPAAALVSRTVRSSWLLKLSPRKSWQKRWCVVSGRFLYYYKSPADLEPVGTLPLDRCEIALMDGKFAGRDVGFQIKFPYYTYRFCDISKKMGDSEHLEWIKCVSTLQADLKSHAERAKSLSSEVDPTRVLSMTSVFDPATDRSPNKDEDVYVESSEDDVEDVDEEYSKLESSKSSKRLALREIEHRSGNSFEIYPEPSGTTSGHPNPTESRAVLWKRMHDERMERALRRGKSCLPLLNEELAFKKFVAGKKSCHDRYFIVSNDLSSIQWASKPNSALTKPEKSILLSDIQCVRYGYDVESSKLRAFSSEEWNRYFVLVAKDRTVEVLAPSRTMCEKWVLGLQYVLHTSDASKPVMSISDFAWQRLRAFLAERSSKMGVTVANWLARKLKEVASTS